MGSQYFFHIDTRLVSLRARQCDFTDSPAGIRAYSEHVVLVRAVLLEELLCVAISRCGHS